MNIAILCHSGAGGSGVLAAELALALSQIGHTVHIIGDRRPFRISPASEAVEGVAEYQDFGIEPPQRSFWGDLVRRVRRSFSGRFKAPLAPVRVGELHFHEVLTTDYPLFQGSELMTLRTANTLARLIEKYSIDVVNAHYVIPHSTSAILARESGLPVAVVTTLHGTDVTKVGSDPAFLYTTRHAIRSSDEVTAVCEFLALEAKRSFGINREIQVIQNWVDSARFVRITDQQQRARYAQPDERLLIHVSNFRPVKRSAEVISTFAKILEVLPARLLLVGDGPDKARCIEMSVELGVSGRILSLPETPNVEVLLGISDVLLLPSEIEGAPLAILEAMAAGAVPVATDVGGVSELIENGVHGFVVDIADSNAFAARVLQVLQDENLRCNMQRAGRERVIARHSPEALVNAYLAVYQTAHQRVQSQLGLQSTKV